MQSNLIVALVSLCFAAPTVQHSKQVKSALSGVKTALPSKIKLSDIPTVTSVRSRTEKEGMSAGNKSGTSSWMVGPTGGEGGAMMNYMCPNRVSMHGGRANFDRQLGDWCKAANREVGVEILFPIVQGRTYAVDCEASTALWTMKALGEGSSRSRNDANPSITFVADMTALQTVVLTFDANSYLIGRCQVVEMG